MFIHVGQTGSGKTYTMGTADNESQDPNNQGLVPRFVCDLFDNIDQYSQNEKLEASVSKCWFLI
jgi:type II secretory ATPase GspE/PulE/Tfp pilus assembly ATPase PilB-like protein